MENIIKMEIIYLEAEIPVILLSLLFSCECQWILNIAWITEGRATLTLIL